MIQHGLYIAPYWCGYIAGVLTPVGITLVLVGLVAWSNKRKQAPKAEKPFGIVGEKKGDR